MRPLKLLVDYRQVQLHQWFPNWGGAISSKGGPTELHCAHTVAGKEGGTRDVYVVPQMVTC